MSLQFNNTSGKSGVLQRIEQELGFPDGFITGDTTRLAQWTASVNLALDRAFHLILKADGRWQFDDSNYTDYPILLTNLKSGQRDYPFVSDQNGNLILEIQRVFVKVSSTAPYLEMQPVDVQSSQEGIISNLEDGRNVQGTPFQYDLTATGIFLDYVPSADVTDGIKIYVSREGFYFVVGDTTRKPGFGGLYHEYCVLEPAYRYARANSLKNQETLKRDTLELEKQITEFYSRRDQHTRPIMTGKKISYI